MRPHHRRYRQIGGQYQQQSRAEPEQAAQIESQQVDATARINLVDEESGNQETAENKEKIDAEETRIESWNVTMLCED